MARLRHIKNNTNEVARFSHLSTKLNASVLTERANHATDARQQLTRRMKIQLGLEQIGALKICSKFS